MSTWSTCTWGFHLHFFSSAMTVACEHRLIFGDIRRETKARNPSRVRTTDLFARKLTSFTLCYYWLVCSTERKQTTNTKGEECGSDVSSHSFGGSVAWHPKKRLRRRLVPPGPSAVFVERTRTGRSESSLEALSRTAVDVSEIRNNHPGCIKPQK